MKRLRNTINSLSLHSRARLSNLFVFFWFLFLTSYLSQQRSFPYIYNDEYGVLGAGAIFSGLEWSTPPGMPFYGFLLSIFTFPLYWLDLEPTMLYRAILAVNGLLVAASAILAIQTIRLLPKAHSEVSLIGIVIAGFSYPAVLHYSSQALGETALLFCFFLIAYHLTILLNTDHTRIFNAIMLGLGLGMAQYAHPRGVAFVIAGVVITLCALIGKSISRKQFTITAAAALSSIALFASLKTYLLTNFYVHEHQSASLLSFVSSKLELVNTDYLVKLMQVSFGQLAYLLASTFGLLVPGLAILTFTTWKELHAYKSRVRSNSDKLIASTSGLLSGFVFLSFILMFGASIMQMASATRADHFFYGRYNEVLAPAIIIASIIFLEHLSKKDSLRWVCTGFLITIFSLLVISLYPKEIFQLEMIWHSITSWFVYIHGVWAINVKHILLGVFSAFIVLAITAILSRRLFKLVLVLFFTSAALHNFELQHEGADRGWKKFNELATKLDTAMPDKQLQVLGSDTTVILKSEALQFAFPKAHVSFRDNDLSSSDAVLDYTGKFCKAINTVTYLDKAKFCIPNDNLRSEIKIPPELRQLDSMNTRPQYPAIIDVPGELKLKGITISTVDKICSFIANRYYTSWFRYCLPTVEITITQHELSGDENHQLGIFITDSKGKWLSEWRVPLDNKKLSLDELIEVTSFIHAPPKINKGDYWLNIATIDDHGWDWRSTNKIKLTVK